MLPPASLGSYRHGPEQGLGAARNVPGLALPGKPHVPVPCGAWRGLGDVVTLAKLASLLLHPQPCCPQGKCSAHSSQPWGLQAPSSPWQGLHDPPSPGTAGGTMPEGVRIAARLKAAHSRAGVVAQAPVKSSVCPISNLASPFQSPPGGF